MWISQATGCGKTHTISGTENDPGIIYLAMADLFQRIADRRADWIVDVQVTFLEIYNEEIRDLLADPDSPTPRGGLSIREDTSVKVVGLTELKPTSAEEVKDIVLQGNSRRTQSATMANATSSRSHAVLQVHVMQSPRTASVTEQKTMGTLSIIDLAGSERAAATTNMGQRMVEGANINKSLLALGNCINALCESGGAIRHVPYRNSKLTRLLKFSLGGNCKTVMIVCVAPTSAHFDDTHNTLLYAERATKIKTKVVTRNVVNVDRHVGQYVEAINRLNVEVAELKAKLSDKVSLENNATKRRKAEAQAEVERAKGDMQAKAEHTRTSVIDGSSCSGSMAAANIKLRAVRSRLAAIDAQASSSTPLPSDLEAERGLLRTLAEPQEAIVNPRSETHARSLRGSNAGNMFEATLRAISERRSDRLDDVSIENVKLDARRQQAEMDRARIRAEYDAVRTVLEAEADMVVNLVGMVSRCTVMMNEAGRLLQSTLEEGTSSVNDAVRLVVDNLKNIASSNDEAFSQFIGNQTSDFASPATGSSSFSSFQGYSTTFTRSASTSALSASYAGPSKSKAPKRLSNVMSPSKKSLKSPRKPVRPSLSGPMLRRGVEKEKKSVQWRDEAGRGAIDDGGKPKNRRSSIARLTSLINISPVPSPSVSSSSISRPNKERDPPPEDGETTPTSRTFIIRPPSSASIDRSSESEWEDDKTDDSSSNISFNGSFVREPRPRAYRLDPSNLKSRVSALPSTLGSLEECDENATPVKRQPAPLTNRSLNLGIDGSHTSKRLTKSFIASPRLPNAGVGSATSSSAAEKSRRKSSIGPVRSEKGKRRSSLLKQSSALDSSMDTSISGTGPRRALLASYERSPARNKPRRISLLSKGSLRTTVSGSSVAKNSAALFGAGNVSLADASASAIDLGPTRALKPTWK
jgi:kinesin family member 18/19